MKIDINNGEYNFQNCNCNLYISDDSKIKSITIIPYPYENEEDIALIKSFIDRTSPVLIKSIKITQGEEQDIFYNNQALNGILNKISYIISTKNSHWEAQIEY